MLIFLLFINLFPPQLAQTMFLPRRNIDLSAKISDNKFNQYYDENIIIFDNPLNNTRKTDFYPYCALTYWEYNIGYPPGPKGPPALWTWRFIRIPNLGAGIRAIQITSTNSEGGHSIYSVWSQIQNVTIIDFPTSNEKNDEQILALAIYYWGPGFKLYVGFSPFNKEPNNIAKFTNNPIEMECRYI